MKKFYTMMAMMLAALVLVSCDDDQEIAYTLEGTWKGNMYVNSVWDGRTYTSTYSEVTFLRDPYRYSSGDGYWVDYYSNAPWDYVANHISWRVDYGEITVYFREENTSVVIRDYRLTDDRFRGWIEDGDNDVEFNLVHTSSPNWNSYNRWGYDGWYDDYYWSRTRSAEADSVGTMTAKPVRVFSKQ